MLCVAHDGIRDLFLVSIYKLEWRAVHVSMQLIPLRKGSIHFDWQPIIIADVMYECDNSWGLCSQVLFAHCGLNKIADIIKASFSIAFSWMKIFIFHSNSSEMCTVEDKSAFIQLMVWNKAGDKPLPELRMISCTHICIIQPQWVKTQSYMT